MRGSHFSLWGLVFLGVLGPAYGWAGAPVTRIEGDQATTRFQSSQSFQALVKKARETLPQMLTRVPGVQSVRAFHQGTEERNSNSDTHTTVKPQIIQVRFQSPQFFPTSLFSVQEKMVECKAETKCTNTLTFQLTGPLHSYEQFRQILNPIDLTAIAGSFELLLSITQKISPDTEPTPPTVQIQFNLLNRNYEQLLKQLRARGVLNETPTQLEIQSAVSLWATNALTLLLQEEIR